MLTQLLAYQRYLIFKESQDLKVIGEANSIKDRLNISIAHSLSATKTLAYIVEQYGVPENFDSVAAHILEASRDVDALQLTREGVITHVYPLAGNEGVVGYNIFTDSARSREAFRALERKALYFDGPFKLLQGYTGVVGRLPIFRPTISEIGVAPQKKSSNPGSS